jgi:hypothetical protein
MMKTLRVLIACEESQVVCIAFREKGHEAYSCDIVDCSGGRPEWHIKGNVLDHLNDGWDLMIAHPPCTRLTVTGNKWYKPEYADRFPNIHKERDQAIEFFMALACAPIKQICIENPVGIMSTLWRKPDQIIQPFYFGHKEPKKTCLWLKNLPTLEHTKHVEPEYFTSKSGKRLATWYYMPSQSPARTKLRNKTFQGIADAMAGQWSAFALSSPPTCRNANAAGNRTVQLMLDITPTVSASARQTQKTKGIDSKKTPTGFSGL